MLSCLLTAYVVNKRQLRYQNKKQFLCETFSETFFHCFRFEHAFFPFFFGIAVECDG